MKSHDDYKYEGETCPNYRWPSQQLIWLINNQTKPKTNSFFILFSLEIHSRNRYIMNRDQERNVSLDHKETLYLKENPSIAGFIWPPTINKPIAIPQVLD